MTLEIFMYFVIGLIIFSAFAFYICRIGSYYIEFDGQLYTVCIRCYGGFDKIVRGGFQLISEKEAREFIEKSKNNPPRIINL